MLRIHCTVEDLARSRMVAGLGPMTEALFALHLWTRGGSAVCHPWRARVRAELGARGAGLEALAQRYRTLPELLHAFGRPAEGRPAEGGAAPELNAELAAFAQVAVLPHWGEVRTQLERIREARARIVIAGGVERLLGTVHPKLRWNGRVLELHDGPDRDVRLDGRGLVLSPGFFLPGRTCVFLEHDREVGGPVLVFPVDPTVRQGLATGPGPDEQALGALVGHTRAAALQTLTDTCTTSELAERLGISLAGASKHAAVLRRAGLVTTLRNRNTALHTLTGLGVALVQRHGTRPPAGSRADIPA
ncbi:winged helix-turn-helix domain-containing protein [Kitasatospora sp. NPDC093806]|uniref:ArsR/SmtB family transcription factor n=1 Tax=Kitasatospora sp. NPDC093806 TaxID=3155075 RepID=UPI00341E0D92